MFFFDQKYFLLIAANGNSTQSLYAWNNATQMFDFYQPLPCPSVTDGWSGKFMDINGTGLLVIGGYRSAGGNSDVFMYQQSNHTFVFHSSIPTYSASSFAFAWIGGRPLLAAAAGWDGTTNRICSLTSKIFLWSANAFTPFTPGIPTDCANSVAFYSIDGRSYIIFANWKSGTTNDDIAANFNQVSSPYFWDSTAQQFVDTGMGVATVGAAHMLPFYIDSTLYFLYMSSGGDSTVQFLPPAVYMWDGTISILYLHLYLSFIYFRQQPLQDLDQLRSGPCPVAPAPTQLRATAGNAGLC